MLQTVFVLFHHKVLGFSCDLSTFVSNNYPLIKLHFKSEQLSLYFFRIIK